MAERFDIIKNEWPAIQAILEDKFTFVSYNTWISPLEPYRMQDDTLYIIVRNMANPGLLDYIRMKYQNDIQLAIAEKTGITCNLNFILPSEAEMSDILNKNILTPDMNNYYSAVMKANLNPQYTFETFVVGPSNKFAHAASLAVAETPGTVYNPLFIYGGVGLGNTHLMQSIAHSILKNDPSKKVLYVSSEKFTNELIDALRNKRTPEFKEKYRTIDVLLIDDIQFIIGKDSTQEEFFHTFNYLYDSQKQIVISSDKPPKDFTTLEDRLRSRFSVGLPVDISSPDYETRMAILHKKEESLNISVPDEIIRYIATNISTNIRELEGALNRVTAFAKLSSHEITLDMAEEVLRDQISEKAQVNVTTKLILNVITSYFGCTVDDILSQKRQKEIAYPRQICMYLCRKLTPLPLQQIGNELGNRDHTTIRHGIERISDELKVNSSLQETIDLLTKKINIGG